MHTSSRMAGRAVVSTVLALYAAIPIKAGMASTDNLADWEICALCHGADGISPMPKFPKLAGQKQSYIEKQFRDFQTGRRDNDGGQMEAIGSEVESAASLRDIARYFSLLSSALPRALPERPAKRAQYEQGRQLFTHGRAGGESALPACASCHALESSAAPWLYGQHRAYTVKQLRDFKQGKRLNDHGEVMRSVAARLSKDEISALGVYLESTSNPLHRKAALDDFPGQ